MNGLDTYRAANRITEKSESAHIPPYVRVGSLADILRCNRDVRFTPRKRTCRPILFNHFGGAGNERFRNRNAERFG